jgi:flagellar basal body-associated protein FliL
MLFVVMFLMIGLGIGVGAVILGRSRRAADPGKDGKTLTRASQSSEPEKPVMPVTLHSLGEIVVNLADVGILRYAKITVTVGYSEKLEDDKLKDCEPILRDALIHVLTAKRYADLHRQGGLDLLKAELKLEFNRRIPEHHVVEVYLEGFGMQ